MLLATYKPDSGFLDMQVKSITKQEGVDIKLFWSDDSDSEIEYIKVKKILDRYPHINVTSNEKKGANQNFLHLLRSASDSDIDFYAALVTPSHGLCRLNASTKIVISSAYGDEIKDKFKSFQTALTSKYGEPEKIYDFLRSKSIWSEEKYWMMSLMKKE